MPQGDINPNYDEPGSYDGRYPPDWDARRESVFERDDWACVNCGARNGPHSSDGEASLQVHHTRPLDNGGTNRLDNLVTLCDSCHDGTEDHQHSAGHGNPTQRESQVTGVGASRPGQIMLTVMVGAVLAIGYLLAIVALATVVSGILFNVGLVGLSLFVMGVASQRPLMATVAIGVLVLLLVGVLTRTTLSEGSMLHAGLVLGGPVIGILWSQARRVAGGSGS